MRRFGSWTTWRRGLGYSALGVLPLDESTALTGRSQPGLGREPRRWHRRVSGEGRSRVVLKSLLSRHLSEDSPFGSQVALRSTHGRTPTTGSSAAVHRRTPTAEKGGSSQVTDLPRFTPKSDLGEQEIRSVLTAEYMFGGRNEER